MFVIVGDLNLNRLRPAESREGKVLNDLKEVHNLQSMITEATGITTSQARAFYLRWAALGCGEDPGSGWSRDTYLLSTLGGMGRTPVVQKSTSG